MGILLTQDPLGLAGGVNLYAYAGNNPVSFRDPFGLCPKCNMKTGDKYLDDPVYRDQMEDAYNSAPVDQGPGRMGAKPPYRAEQGGYCDGEGNCRPVYTDGQAGDVLLPIMPEGAVLSYHTHGSEGRPIDIPNGRLRAQGAKTYSVFDGERKGYSRQDSVNTRRRGVPTYIIRPKHITRIAPDGTITTFDRFE